MGGARKEVAVGDLARAAGVLNPRDLWPVSGSPYVFLSHTGRDNVKEEIARPTHWFLTEICQVEAFLDDGSTEPGTEKSRAIIEPAYRCTHALILLSPTFRSRSYCVQELNTFVLRRKQESEDAFRLIPALWLLQNTDDFAPVVNDLIWLKVENCSAGDYMVHSLWPLLLRELNQEPMELLALEELLVKYVHTHRGRRRPIPACLESFVTSSDIPREIIARRCAQMEYMSDRGSSMSDSFSDSISFTSSRTLVKTPSSRSPNKEEMIRCRTIKQFWKLQTGVGKLVRIECTVSKFAPFTIGPPWLKAKIHLQKRQAMERSSFEPSKEAKVNAMLAVTAGQMVLRMGEFGGYGGHRYYGIYQAIVRNSVPLFASSSYHNDVLYEIFEGLNHSADAVEAIVVGRIIELPHEFVSAFADYLNTEEVATGIIDGQKKPIYAIEVGEEGTYVEYIKPTPYLDGDIWVAVKEDGVTSFKSRFCNLADREDLVVAIESLRREIEGKNINFQFDQVEERFENGEDVIFVNGRPWQPQAEERNTRNRQDCFRIGSCSIV